MYAAASEVQRGMALRREHVWKTSMLKAARSAVDAT